MLFYSQAEIDHHKAWPSKADKLIHEPVYISIDKDVLRKQDLFYDAVIRIAQVYTLFRRLMLASSAQSP